MRAYLRVLFSAIGFSAAFGAGFLAHRDGRLSSLVHRVVPAAVHAAPNRTSHPAGEWFPPSGRAANPSFSGINEPDREMLASIGYAGATAAAPRDRSGVTVYDAARAQSGLNLYISGHQPEAILMDMRGQTLHRWAHDFASLWPGYSPPTYVRITGDKYWRRVYAFPNGDLIALHEGVGLVKLDRDSKLLWKRRDNFHHDFSVTSDGTIYALNRTMEPRVAAPGEEPFLMEPVLSLLDFNGNESRRVPLIPCFATSDYASLLERMPKSGDLFHENSIQVFDGSLADRSPLFAKGNVLISIWTLDAIAIVNIGEQRVVWAMTGMWHRQHEASLQSNGKMLVFDNRGNRGGSRVLELDPFTQRIEWSYAPASPNEFHSEWCGGLQRLANGNTLITETNNGRAFELTPAQEIVWEFVNPNQVESKGTTLISSLWKVTRLPEDYGADWRSHGHE